MRQIFAPFIRVGMVLWVFGSFGASFTLIYQVMLMNGIYPLNTASGFIAIGLFFVSSSVLGLILIAIGYWIIQKTLDWFEDLAYRV